MEDGGKEYILMNQLYYIENDFRITEKKGKAITDSLKIAEIFGKEHYNVIRDIESLECTENFTALNYEVSTYKDSTGKKNKMYLISKDGFTFLVMGYRGKKAAQFKEAYITAFNQMESFIKSLLEAKADFPEFTDAIMLAHDVPKHFHFTNECDMINTIVLGMTAKKYREKYGIKVGESIRPHLGNKDIEAIKTLQRIDIGLLYTTPDYSQRKSILETQYIRLSQKLLIA